jgi:hypothetical protein
MPVSEFVDMPASRSLVDDACERSLLDDAHERSLVDDAWRSQLPSRLRAEAWLTPGDEACRMMPMSRSR